MRMVDISRPSICAGIDTQRTKSRSVSSLWHTLTRTGAYIYARLYNIYALPAVVTYVGSFVSLSSFTGEIAWILQSDSM